jgi:hypothetical protein
MFNNRTFSILSVLIFFTAVANPGGNPAPIYWESEGGDGLKLTTYLHTVPDIRILEL